MRTRKAGIFKMVYNAVKSVVGTKGRPVAKKRYGRKKSYNTRALAVKKVILDPKITQPCNTTTAGSDTFELNDIPQFAQYTNLYQEYRINKIIYSFKTLTNSSTIYEAPGQVTTAGMIHSVITYDNAAPPGSIQTMMNDSSYKGTVSTKNHTRVIYPKFLNDVAGVVADQSIKGWLNTNYTNVSHYGINWFFEGGVATSSAYSSFIVEPIITYYLSFRNPK